MSHLKRFIKNNSHNRFFKALAGFGRALNRFYENRNHDITSNGEITVLKKIAIIKPSVFIDGGANIGNYSLQISRNIPGATIYSFEPVKDTYNQLVINTKEISGIIPVNKGLFNETCNKEINIYKSHTHSSVYDIEGLSYNVLHKAPVRLIKGDDFIKEIKIGQIDFLKIDVEGSEFDVLSGFRESISNGIIRAIQFEYGYINITTKKLLIDFYKFFESHNYIVGKIFPKTVEFREYKFTYEDFLGPNFIAVKRSEEHLIRLLSKR
ncbi:MAG: FkbM family methyltransferase [Bacteroidales bacterium]|nr:FkbM family methyltransferase [Bacteroidales bacterium]